MSKIILPADDGELLKQCRVETFRSGGAGGQHVNVTDSAVRLTHHPTGISVTSQKSRSQHANKQDCLDKLREAVAKLNYRKPRRIPTKEPAGVKRQNAEQKSRASQKKQLRKPPRLEE